MRINRCACVVVGAASILLSACGAPDGRDEHSQAAEQRFSRTVVYRHSDGTETVKVDWVPASVLRSDFEYKVAYRSAMRLGLPTPERPSRSGVVPNPPQRGPEGTSSVSEAQTVQDDPCFYDDVQLWDQTNQGGHTICFVGQSSSAVDLHSYARYIYMFTTYYWDGAVRSYWGSTGDTQYGDGEDGYFQGLINFHVCYEYFYASSTSATNAGSCAQGARYLRLTD